MKIPRKDYISYFRFIMSRRNLSFMFYAIVGIAIIFILTILSLFLLKNIKMIFFILLLMFLGVVTDSINRFMPFSVGFELIMMGTILAARAYSPLIGIMVGVLSLTISELFIMRFKVGLLFSYLGIMIVAFLSHIFSEGDITRTGITLTVIYDMIILPGYYFTGSNPVKLAIFAGTHIAFNIWVFTKLAPFFLGLMI